MQANLALQRLCFSPASWMLVGATVSEDQAGLSTGAGVLASQDPGAGRPRALSDVGGEGRAEQPAILCQAGQSTW